MALLPSPLLATRAVRVLFRVLRRLAGPVQDPQQLEVARRTDHERMAIEIEHFVVALREDRIRADDFL